MDKWMSLKMKTLAAALLWALTVGTVVAADIDGSSFFRRFSPAVVKIVAGDGTGTGFFVNSLGTVLTCDHVVQGRGPFSVEWNGTKYTAYRLPRRFRSKIGLTKYHYWQSADADQVLLQIHSETPTPYLSVRWQGERPSGERYPEVGDPVFVIGYPLGMQKSLNVGRISAISSSMALPVNHKYDGAPKGALKYACVSQMAVFQTDAAINPGNSGGPVFDGSGHVIGLATSKIDTRKVPNVSGMNYVHAVHIGPTPLFQRYCEEIMAIQGGYYKVMDNGSFLAVGLTRPDPTTFSSEHISQPLTAGSLYALAFTHYAQFIEEPGLKRLEWSSDVIAYSFRKPTEPELDYFDSLSHLYKVMRCSNAQFDIRSEAQDWIIRQQEALIARLGLPAWLTETEL